MHCRKNPFGGKAKRRKGPQNVLAKEGVNLPFERMTPDPLHFESLFWEESLDWARKIN
jgi:hypothetical protein